MHKTLGTLSLTLAGTLALLTATASAEPADPTQPLAEAAQGAPTPAPNLHDAAAVQTAQATTTTTTTTTVPPPQAYAPAEPAYDEVTESYNAPVFTSGALVFAASYGASVIVASQDSDRGNNRLYVPVVGPWLALNDRGSCDVLKSSCDHETTAKVLLVADGIFQAAGLIAMIDSVLQPTTHRVVTRTAKRDEKKVHIAPTMTLGNPGFAALGKF